MSDYNVRQMFKSWDFGELEDYEAKAFIVIAQEYNRLEREDLKKSQRKKG